MLSRRTKKAFENWTGHRHVWSSSGWKNQGEVVSLNTLKLKIIMDEKRVEKEKNDIFILLTQKPKRIVHFLDVFLVP